MRLHRAKLSSFIMVFLAACGGGGGAPAPTATFTVGGVVNGLSGSGLALQDNAGTPLAVVSSGAFTFADALRSGAGYSVTVATQPASPAQDCVVTNGSGIVAGANVTNVTVSCT